MPRFGNKGRFDTRYELGAIYEGMREDLQEFIGQYVPWYRFDAANSVVDPIYDVGADTGGRRFKAPFLLPVLGVDLEQGVEINTGQGEYTTDVCHIVVSYDQAEKAGLRRMSHNWRLFMGDRFVYNDTVFQVREIRVRGPVREHYEVLGIDGWEVNAEELVNDPDFAKYAGPGDVTTAHLAEPLLELAHDVDKSAVTDTALSPAVPGAEAYNDLYDNPS